MSAEFLAKPAARAEEPISIGIVGPPGGGKTLSSLRIAKGIQSVRGGDIIVIDTEGGRSRKYADRIPFEIVEFQPPCRSDRFLEAIRSQLPQKPAAIVIDSGSDEHEGEGGYLEWHDEIVPKMGGNDWAAWAKPKASRKRLITGLLHIKVPLIFTFRAREKTKRDKSGSKTVVVNIGWQPVAPLEIVHALDLTCILPPRADGVPVWKSDKIGENFIIKLPNYLKPYIQDGKALCEDMGKGFAHWAKGGALAGDPPPESSTDHLTDDDAALAAAAEVGTTSLEAAWKQIPNERRRVLQSALARRHKPRAAEVDEAEG
jgi:AAA domain